jgi:hypothetical protein
VATVEYLLSKCLVYPWVAGQLHYWTVATPSQAVKIHKVILMVQSHMSQIDKDLAHLQRLQKQLVHQCDEAFTCILLAPIQHLPADLLVVIFCSCLPPHNAKFDLGSLAQDEPSLSVIARHLYFLVECAVFGEHWHRLCGRH